MLPAAFVCHRMAGRVRLCIDSKHHDQVYFARVGRELAAADGVVSVRTNALTASVLVVHGGALQRLADDAAARGLFRLVEDAESPRARMRRGLASLSRDVSRVTGGHWNFADVLFLGLAGFAFSEAVKGNVAAPAATLAWYALSMLSAPDGFDPTRPWMTSEPQMEGSHGDRETEI